MQGEKYTREEMLAEIKWWTDTAFPGMDVAEFTDDEVLDFWGELSSFDYKSKIKGE